MKCWSNSCLRSSSTGLNYNSWFFQDGFWHLSVSLRLSEFHRARLSTPLYNSNNLSYGLNWYRKEKSKSGNIQKRKEDCVFNLLFCVKFLFFVFICIILNIFVICRQGIFLKRADLNRWRSLKDGEVWRCKRFKVTRGVGVLII